MTRTGNGEFLAAVTALPPSLQANVRDWANDLLDRWQATPEEFPGSISGVARLVACSEFAAATLLRDWPELLAEGEFAQAGDRLVASLGEPPAIDLERAAFMRELRCYRRRGLLRILWADLVGGVSVPGCLDALSELAERCIDAAVRRADATMRKRYGPVVTDDAEAVPITLAMGKLGGRELNFSSDVDLVFLHAGNGETSGPRRISAHEFFGRVARETVTLLDEVTPDGFVYRVDTRLRPFGNSGPPVISVEALESYLVEHGRDWERYAYVKARPIGKEPPRAAARLMRDVVAPFVYRRYLDYGVFESLRDMHALIATEVRRREMAQNVKLGPGGIREVEFIVQSLQLVRGGSVAALRTPELRAAILAAADQRDIGRDDAGRLLDAYDVLRRVENALQAIRDRQTHDLPEDDTDRDRLCVALGYDGWPALHAAIEEQRRVVALQFAATGIRGHDGDAAAHHDDIETLWQSKAEAGEWSALLQSMGMADAGDVADAIAAFRRIPALRRIDAVSATRLRRFVGNLLHRLVRSPAPAESLGRVLELVESVLRRSAYLALLNENPGVLDRLLDLCGRSRYLAREMAAYPVLLDELIDARIFEVAPTAEDIAHDFDGYLGQGSPSDAEQRLEALTEFKRSTLFRVAVADFSASMPVMKVSDRLTEVAELILREALAVAQADMERQFGKPRYMVDGVTHEAGLGIIAYGKLAGLELSYSSDLDLVFIHDSHGEDQHTDGRRSQENAVYFSRLVQRLVHLLTVQTGSGALYEIDTRLRPSGRSGLLVTSIEAFEKYQEENAWTWEHQALLRSRPVAGSAAVGERFSEIRAETLRNRVRRATLCDDVRDMRAKMRKQLDASGNDRFDLKNGRGGIGDIEFLVQYQALSIAHEHPDVIRYPDNIRQLDALAASGCWEDGVAARLQDIYRAYRQVAHHLALDDKEAVTQATDFAAEREYVKRCWEGVFGAPPP